MGNLEQGSAQFWFLISSCRNCAQIVLALGIIRQAVNRSGAAAAAKDLSRPDLDRSHEEAVSIESGGGGGERVGPHNRGAVKGPDRSNNGQHTPANRRL